MTRIAKQRAEYRSQLRDEQAEETRVRILDATSRVMADGVASVSIPAVARAAGVSVPTVYRHFGTKQDLLAALYPHAERRAGIGRLEFPRSVDELRGGVVAYLKLIDSFDDLARAAMASPAAAEARQLSMPRRLAVTRRFADAIKPELAEADRDRIARLLVVLTASGALRMWRDHLGLSEEETADEVDWVVRAAIKASRRKGR